MKNWFSNFAFSNSACTATAWVLQELDRLRGYAQEQVDELVQEVVVRDTRVSMARRPHDWVRSYLDQSEHRVAAP